MCTPGGRRVQSRCSVRSPANGWSRLRTNGRIGRSADLPRRFPDERAYERGTGISPCLTARVDADRLGSNCGPVAARPLAGGDSRQHQTENVGEPRVLSDSVLTLFCLCSMIATVQADDPAPVSDTAVRDAV